MTDDPAVRRRLAVGLLIIVLGAVWLGCVSPIIDAFANQAREREDTLALLSQYRAVAAQRPALDRRAAELAQADGARTVYLGAVSDGVAGATVQRHMKQALERAGAELQSTLILPVRSEDSFRRIGIRVQMTGSVEVLRKVLHLIETGQPALFIDGLEIRTRQNPRSVNGKAAEDRTLEVRLDVYGLALPPA